MTILEKEISNSTVIQESAAEKEIVNKEDLCKKICANILHGLLEGYEDLAEKHPEKTREFQPKIEEIKNRIQENEINQKIEEVFSVLQK